MLEGLILLLSGAAALIGGVFLIYYGIRLAVGQVKNRKMEPATRARILAVVASAYVLATISGVVAKDASGTHLIWFATAVIAGVRGWTWRRRFLHKQSVQEPTHEPTV